MTIERHPCLIPIEEGAIIWRYLDFEKFESLLRDKALFFCRLDKFNDPFEGSVPRREVNYRINAGRRYAKRFNLSFDTEKDDKPIADEHKRLKRTTIANCWQINQNESDAMWQLYLKDNEGVAIQSRPALLFSVLNEVPEKIYPSKVRYINYDEDIWYDHIEYPVQDYNFLTPFIHKRIEFIHEREFRIFIELREAEQDVNFWDSQPHHKGQLIKLNVSGLIENVIFPPTCDVKTEEIIKTLAADYGYNLYYEKSKLNREPEF